MIRRQGISLLAWGSAIGLFLVALIAPRVCRAKVTQVITFNDYPFPAVLLSTPPASLLKGALTGQVSVFDELTDFVLPSDLHTDTNGWGHGIPGLYSTPSTTFPGVIPAGTVVSSFMIHFDTAGGAFDPDTAACEVVTDENIIGAIFSDSNLDLSDGIVGSSSTTYPNGYQYRGATVDPLEGNDSLEIGVPGDVGIGFSRTVTALSLEVGGAVDEVRIITAPVPEPASAILAAMAAAGLMGLALPRCRRGGRWLRYDASA
ncbi:MAG TPA: hypothetical protein VMJ32_00795 [Pirellulales bacterium]|nr:hypothetical protein [Pirellulales bacterium]